MRHGNVTLFHKSDFIINISPIIDLIHNSRWLLSDVQLFATPPGSSVHGVLQARILEWVVIPFFRRLS